MVDFPPALLLVLGGFALPFAPPRVRAVLLLGLPLATLALVWNLPDGSAAAWQVHGYELVPVKVDALGRLFATIFAVMGFAGALFALNQARTLELASALVYAGSAIGVALAGDLLTLFVFWELMALASTGVLLAAGEGGSAAGRGPLLRRAHARRSVPDGRGAAPRFRDRLARVHRDGGGFPGVRG